MNFCLEIKSQMTSTGPLFHGRNDTLFKGQILEKDRLGLQLDDPELQKVATLPLAQNQPGYGQSFYGQGRPLLANWSDGDPPSGLGRVDPGDRLWQVTNNDVAQRGYQQDGWKPLWNEPWVKQIQAQQIHEWNVLGVNSARDNFFKFNMGVTNNNRGAPMVLNWERQEPAHPLVQQQGQMLPVMR